MFLKRTRSLESLKLKFSKELEFFLRRGYNYLKNYTDT